MLCEFFLVGQVIGASCGVQSSKYPGDKSITFGQCRHPMISFLLIVLFFSFGFSALVDVQKNEETISPMQRETNIVSHEFCYSCLDEKNQERKQSLSEIHSYAKLKMNHSDPLPSSFTICSSVMTTYGTDHYLMFFGLLGTDQNQWLSAALYVHESKDVLSTILFYGIKNADKKLPPVFPHQWVRSCMAINTKSGLIQWVVDGTLVENNIIDQIKDPMNRPTNLVGNLILGNT